MEFFDRHISPLGIEPSISIGSPSYAVMAPLSSHVMLMYPRYLEKAFAWTTKALVSDGLVITVG